VRSESARLQRAWRTRLKEVQHVVVQGGDLVAHVARPAAIAVDDGGFERVPVVDCAPHAVLEGALRVAAPLGELAVAAQLGGGHLGSPAQFG
jgi:hypothetical protein